MRTFSTLIRSTGWPGRPAIEPVALAPTASTPLIETFRSRPGVGPAWSRPRSPSRMKSGAGTPVITTLEIITPSTLPPSTVMMATPPPSAAAGSWRSVGEPLNTQLESTICRKSPVLSVPSLKQFDGLRIRQFVTSTSSVTPRSPRRKLVFRQSASSSDSMSQLAMRTRRQQSGSMPSAWASRIVTPSTSTSSQPPRLTQ